MRRAKIVLLRLDYLLRNGNHYLSDTIYTPNGKHSLLSQLFGFYRTVDLHNDRIIGRAGSFDCRDYHAGAYPCCHQRSHYRCGFSFEYLKKYIMFCCSMVFFGNPANFVGSGDISFSGGSFSIVRIFMLFMFSSKSADAPAQWQIYTLPYLPLTIRSTGAVFLPV